MPGTIGRTASDDRRARREVQVTEVAPRRVELGVRGVQAGHWTGVGTGVTVLVAPDGAVGGADVRGSAPATRELALLDPTKTLQHVDAIVLTGGSAFGLASAEGVMSVLAEQGQGYETAVGPVPIVCAAALFDLRVSESGPPGAEQGAAAARAAARGESLPVGRVGAGAGATVGKWRGLDDGVPAGLGATVERFGEVTVAVVAAVNAFGDVVERDGTVLAGSTAPVDAPFLEGEAFGVQGQNTTLVVVATDARVDKVGAKILAESAHDGFARALQPVHTRADGDVAFALATGAIDASPLDELRAAVPDLVADAIRDAVRSDV